MFRTHFKTEFLQTEFLLAEFLKTEFEALKKWDLHFWEPDFIRFEFWEAKSFICEIGTIQFYVNKFKCIEFTVLKN